MMPERWRKTWACSLAMETDELRLAERTPPLLPNLCHSTSVVQPTRRSGDTLRCGAFFIASPISGIYNGHDS